MGCIFYENGFCHSCNKDVKNDKDEYNRPIDIYCLSDSKVFHEACRYYKEERIFAMHQAKAEQEKAAAAALTEEQSQKSSEEPKSSKILLVVFILLLVIVIGLGGFLTVKTINKRRQGTNTENVDSSNTTEKIPSDNTFGVGTGSNTKTESDDTDLPYVDSNATEDYYDINSIDDFQSFSAEGYNFVYPKNFYNYVEKTENDGYLFKGSDGSTLKVERYYNDYSSNKSAYDDFASKARNKFYIDGTIIDNPDSGRYIVTGVSGVTHYYYLVTIEDDYIYHFEVGYPSRDSDSKDYKVHQAYVIDCIYRKFTKSGNTHAVYDTYSEFYDSDSY